VEHQLIDERGLCDLSSNFPSVVCLLLINYVETLPNVAIRSIKQNSDCLIIVGYQDYADIRDLEHQENVYFFRLGPHLTEHQNNSDSRYQDFSTDQFFELVKLKWHLLQMLIRCKFKHVIYTDLDVVWKIDLATEMYQAHLLRPDVLIYIQSFTEEPSNPRLCMGFISFMGTPKVADFLASAESVHISTSREIKRFGDDDAITRAFKDQNFPNFVQELPQSTFPVGSLLNLYSRRQLYPGLYTPRPKLFHANYVIGLDNKIVMLKLFLGKTASRNLGIVFDVKDYLRLTLRRAKHNLGKAYKTLFDSNDQ
jgi:hypothetical protein